MTIINISFLFSMQSVLQRLKLQRLTVKTVTLPIINTSCWKVNTHMLEIWASNYQKRTFNFITKFILLEATWGVRSKYLSWAHEFTWIMLGMALFRFEISVLCFVDCSLNFLSRNAFAMFFTVIFNVIFLPFFTQCKFEKKNSSKNSVSIFKCELEFSIEQHIATIPFKRNFKVCFAVDIIFIQLGLSMEM